MVLELTAFLKVADEGAYTSAQKGESWLQGAWQWRFLWADIDT